MEDFIQGVEMDENDKIKNVELNEAEKKLIEELATIETEIEATILKITSNYEEE